MTDSIVDEWPKEVDGIPVDPWRTQGPIVGFRHDHHGCYSDPCGFDSDADFRQVDFEFAVSSSYRWRPGDPIYRGGAS